MTARRRRRGPTHGGYLAAFLVVWVVLLVWASLTATVRLGLDLQGGIGIVLTAPPGTSADVVDKASQIIRSRVDALGVAEPEITREGDRNIQVQLPGVKDPDSALRIIGTTAQLQFRPVLEILGAAGTTPPTATDTVTPTAEGSVTATTPASTTATATTVTPPEQDLTDTVVVLTDTTNTRYRLGPAEVLGSDITDATARQESRDVQGNVVFGGWVVDLYFNSRGEAKFRDSTGRLACNPAGAPTRRFAIVLDHVIQSAPQVAETVQCGQGIGNPAQITIGQSPDAKKEAQDLATVLRFGALPAPFERSNVQEVSATLGRDSLRTGLVAGTIGLILVAGYAVFYYRALGAVIIAGLFVFAGLLWSVFSLLSETAGLSLSLAGVAGVIVSIGITTDSYIVYFERIKEEVREGRTVRSAVDKGFRRAFRTILTADAVSLAAAAVLYLLAVSSVKGFALLLGISTILDICIAWFFTRNVVALLLPTKWFSEGRFIGISHTTLGAATA